MRIFSEEAVLAVAKTLFSIEEPDLNAVRWDKPNPKDPKGPLAWHDYWLDAARAALYAADQASPEEPAPEETEGKQDVRLLRSMMAKDDSTAQRMALQVIDMAEKAYGANVKLSFTPKGSPWTLSFAVEASVEDE